MPHQSKPRSDQINQYKNTTKYQAIVLAAGSGKRMGSSIPKVLHTLNGITMLDMVLSNLSELTDDIILVHSLEILDYIQKYCKHNNTVEQDKSDIQKGGAKLQFVLQERPLGTAHAVSCAIDKINHALPVIVIYADNPLINARIMRSLLEHIEKENASTGILAFQRNDPSAYGRIALDEYGNFVKIIEFKDASDEEKKITLCNSGIMAFAPNILNKYLNYALENKCKNSELYLTDMVRICKQNGEKVSYLLSNEEKLIVGINTQLELESAEKLLLELNPSSGNSK